MGGGDECLAGRESYQDSSATSLLPSSESKLKSPLNIQMCPFRVNPADMNEPYYRDYLATDLGAIAQEAGLECGMKVCACTTLHLNHWLESFTQPWLCGRLCGRMGSTR